MADETTPQGTPAAESTEEELTEEESTEEEAPAEPEVPEDLSSLEEQALRELHAGLEATYASRRPDAKTDDDVAALRAYRDAQKAIVTELEARGKRLTDLSELDENVITLPEAPASEAPTAEEVANEMDTPADSTQSTEPAMAASIAAARSGGGTNPAVQNAATPAAPRPRATFQAAAGNALTDTGAELDMETIGRLFDSSKRNEGETIFARLASYQDMGLDAPMLDINNSTELNDRIIREATQDWVNAQHPERATRTAAICDPLDIIRQIPDCSTAEERVSRIFPSRPVGRLGFQFSPSITMAEVAAGSTIWDEADQALVDPDDPATWKPCVEVLCPPVDTVRAEWVTGCMFFDITTEMSNPERVENAMRKLAAQRARNKESRLLTLIDSLSLLAGPILPATPTYGAIPDLVRAVLSILAQISYTERLAGTDYVLIAPPGTFATLAIDKASRAFGDACEPAAVQACIQDALGIPVIETLDTAQPGTSPFTPVTTNIDLPNTYRFRLVSPGDAIYGETGEMNVGTTRDSQLIRRNQVQWFSEEAFLLAKHGCNPWVTFDLTICGNGSRAGFATPFVCTAP